MAKILSQKFYSEVEKLEKRYPTRVAMLIPLLHVAQDESGWLSPQVMDEVAEVIGIHPAQVREVASFYTMFYLEPVGKNTLRLCTNVACCLRGADELMEHMEKKLGVKCGETTQDGKFTLMEEECLGACGTAPAMLVNNKEYHENLDDRKVEELINKLGSGA